MVTTGVTRTMNSGRDAGFGEVDGWAAVGLGRWQAGGMGRRCAISVAVAVLVLGSSCSSDGADTKAGPPSSSAAPSTSPSTSSPSPHADARPSVEALLSGQRVLSVAHAGGDQDFPHSTMYAFAEAVVEGADVLEMDVRTTADGVVVVHHDADTAKTTPESLVVAETDLAALQALDRAHWFSPQCWPCQDRPVEEYVFRGVRTGERPAPDGYGPDDFRLVTLAEVSERFPAVPFDIEIKGEGFDGLRTAAALATELERLGRTESSIVVSFDSAVVAAFHDAAPTVATSPGVAELTDWLLADVPLASHHRVIQIPPAFDGIPILSPATVAKAHDAGLEVWVWMNDPGTQENEAFYRSLVAMDVDGLIAGRPALARRAIDS